MFSGHRRPLVDANEDMNPHEVILRNQRTELVSIPTTILLVRVFKMQYEHDNTGSDPDNSAECDGYSDVRSLSSAFGETVNIQDPEVCAQMTD